MSLRSQLQGTFSGEELRRLTWPVAWSCAKDAADAAEEESDLSSLVCEALEEMETYSRETGISCSVKIENGEIVELVEDEDSEED